MYANSGPRVAYLIGASGGLGSGIAAAFVEAGWSVGLGGREASALDRLREGLPGGKSSVAAVDATDASEIRGVFDRWRTELGPPDACLCLVGAYLGGKRPDDWTAAEWRAQFEANLLAPAMVLGQAFAALRDATRPGLLVAVSALAGVESPAGKLPYGATKAGLLQLLRGLGDEGAPLGIRALALVPRIIDTPANRAAMPSADAANWSSPVAIGRMLVSLAGEGGAVIAEGVLRV